MNGRTPNKNEELYLQALAALYLKALRQEAALLRGNISNDGGEGLPRGTIELGVLKPTWYCSNGDKSSS